MDRTERFRGRFVDGDRIVLEPLEGLLKTHNKHAGQAEWTGHFEYPPEKREVLTAGKAYQLVLIDGRRGTVRIHLSENDPLGRALVNFHGSGSPKR